MTCFIRSCISRELYRILTLDSCPSCVALTNPNQWHLMLLLIVHRSYSARSSKSFIHLALDCRTVTIIPLAQLTWVLGAISMTINELLSLYIFYSLILDECCAYVVVVVCVWVWLGASEWRFRTGLSHVRSCHSLALHPYAMEPERRRHQRQPLRVQST